MQPRLTHNTAAFLYFGAGSVPSGSVRQAEVGFKGGRVRILMTIAARQCSVEMAPLWPSCAFTGAFDLQILISPLP